ncbi:hypothetical protein NQZ68_022410 [Dissostichus eleginoides]|nr:hypothetical protein NQZ68_022410 [Dissostichus eleginoides]
MMLTAFICCIFHLAWITGASNSDSVFQTPPFIMKRSGESVDREINCSHNIPSYDCILWYKQDQHQNMKFLGYLNSIYSTPEDDVKGKISFDGDGRKQSRLSVSNLSLEDSAQRRLSHRHSPLQLFILYESLQSLSDIMDVIIFKHSFLTVSIFLLWTTGLTDGSDVTQTDMLWETQGDNATISCIHTKGATYSQMYWYRQLPGETMELVVFTTPMNIDNPDFGGFKQVLSHKA